MTTSYTFNPIQGWTLLAAVRTGEGFAGMPATTTRVRCNVLRLLQACLTVAAQAEMMARARVENHTAVIQPFPVDGSLVCGTLYKDMRSLSKADNDPYADVYMGTCNALRWLPENVTNSYAKDPELLTPSTPLPSQQVRDVLTLEPAAIAGITIGVIGVAAAAAAGLAWWGGKRADANASVAVDSLRTLATADMLQNIAMQQVKLGQPIDPNIVAAIRDMGKRAEEHRSWGVPVAIGVGAGGLAIGGGVAVWKG